MCVHPRPPPLDYWYISFFFLVGPGPLHEIAVSAFSCSPLGRANTFSFHICLQPPYISTKCFSSFTVFLSANFAFSSVLSFASVLYPPKFSTWTVHLGLLNPKSFHIFSTTLSHLISARPFVTSSRTTLSFMYGWQPLFRHIIYFMLPFQLSHVSFCFKWVHS